MFRWLKSIKRADPFKELGEQVADGIIKGMTDNVDMKERKAMDKADKPNVSLKDIRQNVKDYDALQSAVKATGIPLKEVEKLAHKLGTQKSLHATIEDVLENTTWHVGGERENHTIIDPMIDSFSETVHAQQEKVLKTGKYSHPIHKDNHSMCEWLDHQGEEIADAMVYHECMKQTVDDIIYLIDQALLFNEDRTQNGQYAVENILNEMVARLRKG